MRATTLLNRLLGLPGVAAIDPGSWQVAPGGGEIQGIAGSWMRPRSRSLVGGSTCIGPSTSSAIGAINRQAVDLFVRYGPANRPPSEPLFEHPPP